MTSNKVENCPVCYSELTLKNMMNLRCSHQLCKDCFYNWVDETGKNSCPCCRDEIMKSENFMKEEKLRAEAYVERMEFAAETWKDKRDKKRKQYIEISYKVTVAQDVFLGVSKRCREETSETARVLCLKNKYENKIRELKARVTVSMSPYDLVDYYQKKLDKNLNYADRKARNCFKEVLKEMKEVFACYINDRGKMSYSEEILMLIDGMKFTKELMKENRLEAEWNVSDMFDAEVGPMSEEDEKLEKEYNEKNTLFLESSREMRECVGMINEDPKTNVGFKVLRAFGVKRQWVKGEYDYSSNDTNNYESRPIIYKYNKRVGDWIWIHDEREKAEIYKSYDWARERQSIDEETDRIMDALTHYNEDYEEDWKDEDMNLNELFYEEESDELYEEGTYDEDSDTDSSMPELEDVETTFSEDEFEYDRAVLNLPRFPMLEEGEIYEGHHHITPFRSRMAIDHWREDSI